MRIGVRAFHVPKRGNAESEYEDAYFPREAPPHDVMRFRCAVADGASESAFAGIWAGLLVRSFGRRKLELARLRKAWQRKAANKPLPWFLERKVKSGAHAAFLGLSIRDRRNDKLIHRAAEWLSDHGVDVGDRKGRRWRALAIGDTCLFHVRGAEVVAYGPLRRSDQFNNSPQLICSTGNGLVRNSSENLTIFGGAWKPGDVFYLATDALACWIMAEMEARRAPWAALASVGNNGQTPPFEQWVEELRGRGMKNDDTTLLRVEVAA
jgi:hypothetical protein